MFVLALAPRTFVSNACKSFTDQGRFCSNMLASGFSAARIAVHAYQCATVTLSRGAKVPGMLS
eukprot:3337888-Pyramimonas_sp.AAC.1